jgi:hypothetical protein
MTVVAIATLTVVRASSRDAKRQSDLNEISKAIQLYYNDFNDYNIYSYFQYNNPALSIGKNEPFSIYDYLAKRAYASMMAPTPMACSNGIYGADCTIPYPNHIGTYLNRIPFDPLNNADHYYKFIPPADGNYQKICFIINSLERQNFGYYASQNGTGKISIGATSCP